MGGETLFFRFATAIAMVTAIGLVSVAIEKECLALRRATSAQVYQLSSLQEQRAEYLLRVEQGKTPERLQQQWSDRQASQAAVEARQRR